MSALPPEADIRRRIEHVRYVPKADMTRGVPHTLLARRLCQLIQYHRKGVANHTVQVRAMGYNFRL